MGEQITETPDKTAQILRAALDAFSAYGFRRTAMADIADRAGMSRPALYLHYSGKEEIFRALVDHFYRQCARDVETALSSASDPEHALRAAFAAQINEAVAALLTSPHGTELMDQKHAIGAEAVEQGEARMRAVYARWLERGRDAGRLSFEGAPVEVATVILGALYGQKEVIRELPALLRGMDRLAMMLGASLRG